MYATIIGTTDHKWNMGASYIFDDYKERFSDANYDRIERVPGVFGEYSYSIGEVLDAGGQIRNKQGFKEKIGIVAGVRLDHHNQYGWLFTPRLNLKYNFSDNSIVRLSAGRGFRTVNVIAENIGLLASSRDIILWDELDMEDAWNFGVNFVQKFNLGVREGSIAIDAYRTQFDNQVIMDREHDIRQVVFYNLRGRSFSNSLLAVLSYDLIEGLEMKLAYKMNDVKIDFVHGFEQKPFVSRHRGLITLDYETKDEAWNFNTSVQMVGKQRFPDNSALPDDLEENFKGFSPAYAIWNGQISRTFKNWELYVGVENITGYTQQNAIIDWENPFGDYFDATQVYAPVSGTMGYIGLRIDIDEGEKKDK